MKAEGLGSFFKTFGRMSAKAGKIQPLRYKKNPSRALEITSNVLTAAAIKSPKATLSNLPEGIIFYHPRKGFYLGKFV